MLGFVAIVGPLLYVVLKWRENKGHAELGVNLLKIGEKNKNIPENGQAISKEITPVQTTTSEGYVEPTQIPPQQKAKEEDNWL
jgi:hypothetical protein